jgi:hypothetical protein
MKYIKQYESFRYVEVNESLKGVVMSTLFGLSSIISSGQSMLDPNNPIGLTSPISPNNPSSIMSPMNPNGIYSNNTTDTDSRSLDDMKSDLLKNLDSIPIHNDANLIEVRRLINEEEINIDLVRDKLYDYCKKNNITVIDDEVIDSLASKDHRNIKKVIADLNSIASEQMGITIIEWFIVICVIILLTTLLILWKM